MKQMRKPAEPPVVVEFGAGTGKLTELFLGQGAIVYAVEPNDDMRNQLAFVHGHNPRLHIINATAEESMLPENFADLVVVAHAFHWFDEEKCQKEFSRILKQGGKVGLVWNWYADTLAMREYNYLVHNECAIQDFLSVRGKITTQYLDSFFEQYQSSVYKNNISFDFNRAIKLAASTHCTPIKGEPGYGAMVAKLRHWFSKHQQNGLVKFSYDTTLYHGTLERVLARQHIR